MQYSLQMFECFLCVILFYPPPLHVSASQKIDNRAFYPITLNNLLIGGGGKHHLIPCKGIQIALKIS